MSFELIGLVLAFIGTVAGVIQAWFAWQQSREVTSRPLNSKSTVTHTPPLNNERQKTAKIPWGWLVGNLLMNVLVGFLLNAYLISISSHIAVLVAVVAVLWVWSRHWVEFATEAKNVAVATFGTGILVIAVLFNAIYKIPLPSAFLGSILSYGAITAIPDKAKHELFQGLGKVYGFLLLILIALSGLGMGWIIRQMFMKLS